MFSYSIQMVFYFDCCDSRFVVFMGKDKYENEELLKYAFPEDVWFHVDSLSSAHVYLRRPFGLKLVDIPDDVIDEMCQLVKQNSIEGCKAESADIIYCEFGNLVKTKGMQAGAVSYKNEKDNHYVRGVKKDRDVLKRIERSREEKFPDLPRLRQDRDLEHAHREKKRLKDIEAAKQADKAKAKEADDLLHYVAFQNRSELKQSSKAWAGDGTVEHCKQVESDFM